MQSISLLIANPAMLASALLLGIAGLLAWWRPGWCAWPAATARFRALAARPVLAPLAVFLLLVLGRLALLPIMGWPAGIAGDDGSLILLAQTLLAGRLANPVHPFADFIESVYVHQQPSYGSMFFPGRAFELALGIALADQPALGALLMWGLAGAALVWMVRAWVSAEAGLAAGIVFAVNYGLFSYVANRLYGHGLPVLGGILVIGAWHRLRAAPDWRSGLLFALGFGALALTRPFEGALLGLPLGLVLLWRTLARRDGRACARALLPLVLVLAGVAGFLLAFNRANTGDAVRFAYDVNRTEYAGTPAFIFQKAAPPTHAMPPSLRDFYATEGQRFAAYAQPGALLRSVVEKLVALWAFYAGPLLTLPLLAGLGLWLWRQPALLAGAVLVLAGFMAQQWAHPHYLAPLFGLLLLTIMQGAAAIAGTGPSGLALVRGLFLSAAAVPLLAISWLVTGWPLVDDPGRPMLNRHFCCQPVRHFAREAVVERLGALGGRHLVFVRFHPGGEQWVFNDADVDAATIIWAHDLGDARNAEMARHYADRRVWLAERTEADALRPYAPAGPPAR